MSLVDRIFASIPGPLINQWGIDGVYIKHADEQQYNPATGTYDNPIDRLTGSPKVLKNRINIKMLPVQLQAEDIKGEVQMTDVKILIAATSLGSCYPRTKDWIEYTQDGQTRTAKIIFPNSYRGDSPVFHSVIARLS